MATTTVHAIARVLKNISVVVDADLPTPLEFAEAVSSYKFAPAQNLQTWKGGKPGAVFSDMGAPTWSLALGLAQDIESSASLLNYLMAHAGEPHVCDFIPSGGAKVRATVILAAPEIGGDIDSWLTTSITCGVQGAPVISGTTAPTGG